MWNWGSWRWWERYVCGDGVLGQRQVTENVTHPRAFMVKEPLQSQRLSCIPTAVCDQGSENTDFLLHSVPLFPVCYLPESSASDEPLLAMSCILSLILSTCKCACFFPGAVWMSRMLLLFLPDYFWWIAWSVISFVTKIIYCLVSHFDAGFFLYTWSSYYRAKF